MSGMKEIFTMWQQYVATDFESSLKIADQLYLCSRFISDPENLERLKYYDSVEEFDEPGDGTPTFEETV